MPEVVTVSARALMGQRVCSGFLGECGSIAQRSMSRRARRSADAMQDQGVLRGRQILAGPMFGTGFTVQNIRLFGREV